MQQYTNTIPQVKAHASPFRPSSTNLKLLSQSPQYPFTHSSTCFSFPCLAALSSSFPTLLHLCVSSSNQFSYSASTTSFSMRLTTRSATSKSCRCAPRLCRVRWRRCVLCVGVLKNACVGFVEKGSWRSLVKVWWLCEVSFTSMSEANERSHTICYRCWRETPTTRFLYHSDEGTPLQCREYKSSESL